MLGRCRCLLLALVVEQLSSPLSVGALRLRIVAREACVIDEPSDGEIRFRYDKGALCIKGRGYETRAPSTIKMIKDAVGLLEAGAGGPLPNLQIKRVSIGDMGNCSFDFSYAMRPPRSPQDDCETKLIPDFTLESWPQVKVPNFDKVAFSLEASSKQKPLTNRCGWAGNLKTNPVRQAFASTANKELIDVYAPDHLQKYMTYKDQVEKWACMIDLPGAGYSGRVPMLLHTGRPLLVVGRANAVNGDRCGTDLDHVFYADKLKPFVHYFPVRCDLLDLNERAKWILDPANKANVSKVAENARAFANRELTYHAAIEALAATLKEAWEEDA